jgi:16S rRNA (guanine(966)-N(2))-methyltransferase RsmD
MRITGGRSRNRLLSSLKGLDIRPSSDKLRESIFNIIGQDISGIKVLDLFAGTGSLGIEALSRGAEAALFVDKSRQSISLIKKNLKLADYESSGFILKWDLIKGLPIKHPLFKKKMNLVFIDPPYGKGYLPPILEQLSTLDVLSPHSIVVAESSKNDKIPHDFGRLELFDTRNYGETKLNIYSYEESR